MWHRDYKSLHDKLKAGHIQDILRMNNWSVQAENASYERAKAQRQGGQQQNLNKYL